ncbi:MAG: phosphoglycerate mutase family protein [Candidatus Paceibacterota bacterium]
MNINKPPQMSEGREKPEVRIFFIRHSKATYGNYADKLDSEFPESQMNIEEQLPDLPEAGIEMAQKAAAEFISKLDPEKDVLYVVSSNQMRALETAHIYIEVAQAAGIEVIEHEKTGTNVANKIGEGKVRSLENLSLHMENQVHGAIFNTPAHTPPINFDGVSEKTKKDFEKARAIVLSDERGTWGANFHAHAVDVQKFIPDMETPESLHETQFKNLSKLAEFARAKATGEKRVNVLAFGHENYMGHALEQDTGKEGIANVEAVEIDVNNKLHRF